MGSFWQNREPAQGAGSAADVRVNDFDRRVRRPAAAIITISDFFLRAPVVGDRRWPKSTSRWQPEIYVDILEIKTRAGRPTRGREHRAATGAPCVLRRAMKKALQTTKDFGAEVTDPLRRPFGRRGSWPALTSIIGPGAVAHVARHHFRILRG